MLTNICYSIAEHLPCDANPCRNGGTCLNTGQSLTCVCGEGYEGQHCQLEQRTTASPTSCSWSGHVYPDNSSWDDDCNKCQCRSGRTICTRVWCGPKNCLDDQSGSPCGQSEICVPVQSGCLRQPCAAWGQCRPLKPGRLLPVDVATSSCWPNLTGNRLAPTCARMTLVLDLFRAVPGFSVQSLCGHLRKLAAAQSHLWDTLLSSSQQNNRPSLVILCDLKDHHDDVIQVTVVSFQSRKNTFSMLFNFLHLNLQSMAEEYGMSRASAAARVLGDVLTAHYKGSSSMAALIEVKVETAVPSDDADLTSSSSPNGLESESNYMVVIICAILAGLIIVAGLLVLLLWRLRKRNPTPTNSSITSSSGALEKSNNLQNEENLRLQQRRMKTLNVSELDVVGHQASMKKLKSDDTSEESSSEESYSNAIIESSPIYKAPISVDVRNNIHLAARAGQMIDKELSLKVAVV